MEPFRFCDVFLVSVMLVLSPVFSQLPPPNPMGMQPATPQLTPQQIQMQQMQKMQQQMQQMRQMQQQQQQQQQGGMQQQQQPQMQNMQQMQQQMQQQQGSMQQQQQPMQTQNGIAPQVDFDFNGFFDHYINLYGRQALMVLQDKLDTRKAALGLVDNTPQATQEPAAPVLPGTAIPCGLAVSYVGASLKYNHPQRIHGSTATYRCDSGYRGAETVILCTSGTWSVPTLNVTCNEVHCGLKPVMQNAQVTNGLDTVGTTAAYHCDPGFQADNLASPIVCQENGMWSTPSFSCVNMHQQNHMMSHMHGMNGMNGMGGGAGGMGGMSGMGGMGGMSGMPGMGGMGGAAPPTLNGPLQNAMQQAMGGGGAQNPMAAMMSAMMGGGAGGGMGGMGGMAGMLQGMMGGQGAGAGGGAPAQGALPPHLQSLGQMAPMMMNGMMGGMNGVAAPAATGPGAMEPEKQQEQMMMTMMMRNMFAQQQRKRAMMMQQKRFQEQQQRMRMAQEQERQRKLKEEAEKAKQQQSNAVNLSDMLALASNAQGTGNSGVTALSNLMQQLKGAGASGGSGNNDMLSALKTLGALANAVGQQPNSGTAGGTAQNTAPTGSEGAAAAAAAAAAFPQQQMQQQPPPPPPPQQQQQATAPQTSNAVATTNSAAAQQPPTSSSQASPGPSAQPSAPTSLTQDGGTGDVRAAIMQAGLNSMG